MIEIIAGGLAGSLIASAGIQLGKRIGRRRGRVAALEDAAEIFRDMADRVDDPALAYATAQLLDNAAWGERMGLDMKAPMKQGQRE